ncbi:kinase-like domain-containing protein [Apiospora hydei]|uniref:non-specific serine/threonine protein kinase n=1 Tax=Apiospora hydei TaxID=1337664 RepID=A0ABR1XDP7_9PEZI
MSTADLRKYRQAGVFLPHYRGNRASADRENARGIVADKGFLFVKELGGDKLFLVQSLANNRLYVNKILVRTDDDQNGDFKTQLPPELRFSIIGAPGPGNVQFDYLIDETYFTKLDYWKRLNAKAYYLYFQFANGGTLEQLIEKYRELGDEVPEHFIWHVAVELGEALKYLQRGDQSLGRPPRRWPRIYHRDLVPNNVFVNYAPVGQSRGNRGTVKNAFPEIVLGDFGLAADLLPSVHFDDPGLAGHPASNRPNDWEDVHYYGGILRRLFMASIDEDDYLNPDVITPEQFTVRAANTQGLPAGRRRYSATLEAWLQVFEWPNMDSSDIEQSQGQWCLGAKLGKLYHLLHE